MKFRIILVKNCKVRVGLFMLVVLELCFFYGYFLFLFLYFDGFLFLLCFIWLVNIEDLVLNFYFLNFILFCFLLLLFVFLNFRLVEIVGMFWLMVVSFG